MGFFNGFCWRIWLHQSVPPPRVDECCEVTSWTYGSFLLRHITWPFFVGHDLRLRLFGWHSVFNFRRSQVFLCLLKQRNDYPSISLRAWSVKTGEEIASAFGHSSRPFSIEVSRELGILTAGADQTICVWRLNVNKFDLRKQIILDGGPIRSLQLIGNRLVNAFRTFLLIQITDGGIRHGISFFSCGWHQRN